MNKDNEAWWAVDPEDAQGMAELRADGVRLARLDRLARAALSAAPVDLSCAECRARMPDLLGPDAAESAARLAPLAEPRLAAAAAHVLRCAYCADELVALGDVLAAAAAGRLPAVDAARLDLGFLDGPVVTWTALPDNLRRLAGEVRIAVGEAAARFLPTPGLPTARPAELGLLRGGDGEADSTAAEVLILPDDAADLTIRLSVGPAVGGRAAIALTLGQLEGGGPLPDTRVVLYDAQEQLLASAKTETDGSALFRDLVAGRYLLEVRRGAGRWRLPLVVAAAG